MPDASSPLTINQGMVALAERMLAAAGVRMDAARRQHAAGTSGLNLADVRRAELDYAAAMSALAQVATRCHGLDAGQGNNIKVPDFAPESPRAEKPDDVVHLFRIESAVKIKPASGPASWLDDSPAVVNTRAASGRWFADDIREVEWYLRNEYYDSARLVQVSLPASVAESYRVSNLKAQSTDKMAPENPVAFSRRPNREFFLPPEIAALAIEVDPLSHEEVLEKTVPPVRPASGLSTEVRVGG